MSGKDSGPPPSSFRWHSSSLTMVHCDTSEPEPAVVGTMIIGRARSLNWPTPVHSAIGLRLVATMAMPLPVHITEPPPMQTTPSMPSRRTRSPWASMWEQRASMPHSSKRAVLIPAPPKAASASAWNGWAEMTGSETTRTRVMPRSRASLPSVASDPAPATMRVGM